jgi:hypothetical protein
MNRRLTLLALIACRAFGDDWNRVREPFRFTYELRSGGKFTLEGFNGPVEILGWDRNEVEITGEKYASSDEYLKEIKIDTTNTPEAVGVRAWRPKKTDGDWWGRNGGGGVKFIVRVPKKVQLDRISSSNGSIRVESIEGSARLNSSNGAIRVSFLNGSLDAASSNGGLELRDINGGMTLRTSNGTIRADNVRGSFEASTSNGAIRARLAQVPASTPVRATSSNGTIELTLESFDNNEVRARTSNSSIVLNLPPSVNAQLRAETSNSNVDTDYEVSVRGAISKNRIDGRIGQGGPLIDLSSSNGSIRVRKL